MRYDWSDPTLIPRMKAVRDPSYRSVEPRLPRFLAVAGDVLMFAFLAGGIVFVAAALIGVLG